MEWLACWLAWLALYVDPLFNRLPLQRDSGSFI